MSRPDESLIRDPDLREALEKARGTAAYGASVSFYAESQARRDREAQELQDRSKRLAAMPRDAKRRATIREVIETKAPTKKDLQYIHSVLAICGLPYTRQPIEVRDHRTEQGSLSLMVKAGELLSPTGEWVAQPLPYGSRARLLLLHLCTEAIRQKSPTIQIEDSLTAFVRAMGYPDNGGERGALTAFKQQVNALAACTMRIGTRDGLKATTINTAPFAALDVWFPANPDQKMLWPSTITFSRDFYDTLSRHALPANMHAVKAFAGSPRKLDLYFWLIYRLNIISDPLRITWEGLKEQFGKGFARDRDFRSAFADDVQHLREVFPRLPLSLDTGGLTLQPESPEILAVPVRRAAKKLLKA